MPAGPAPQSTGFSPTGGWRDADGWAECDAGDIQTTMALFQKWELTVPEVWSVVAGGWRRRVGANELYELMMRWNARPWRVAVQQELPIEENRGKTMSRIRSLHPSQWSEEDFVRCSMPARLMLLGLRNLADDRGVFEWRPLSIKMSVFPGDDVDPAALLDELADNRQIARFEAGGRVYGLCIDWEQRPQKPSYRYPEPPAELRETQSRTDTGPVDDQSRTDTGPVDDPTRDSESDIGKGGGGAPAREAHTPVPKDLPEVWRAEAANQRAERGKPAADLDDQWRRFVNHFRDTPERITLGRWLNWSADARAAPGGVDPPAAEPRKDDRPADWQAYPAAWRAKARRYVDQGLWLERDGPRPGELDCKMPEGLIAWALSRRREAPQLLLPSKGGRAAA